MLRRPATAAATAAAAHLPPPALRRSPRAWPWLCTRSTHRTTTSFAAVSPEVWNAATAHTGSHYDGTHSSGAAPAPAAGPAAAANATDGGAAAALGGYLSSPDTVVIVLGILAILLTLTAIGLRLYRSEEGCCRGGRAAQHAAGAWAPLGRATAAAPALSALQRGWQCWNQLRCTVLP